MKYADLPDYQLLQLWRGGHKGAGDGLFRRYAPILRRFFASKTTPDQIGELIQRTWLDILRVGERTRDEGAADPVLQPTQNVRAYILAFARYAFLRFHRERSQDSGQTFDPDLDSVASLDPSQSRQLSAARRSKRLDIALQSLPVELQMLVEARYVEELTGPEIAVMFGIPEGTVRSRLSRARRLLYELLEAMESDRESDWEPDPAGP